MMHLAVSSLDRFNLRHSKSKSLFLKLLSLSAPQHDPTTSAAVTRSVSGFTLLVISYHDSFTVFSRHHQLFITSVEMKCHQELPMCLRREQSVGQICCKLQSLMGQLFVNKSDTDNK